MSVKITGNQDKLYKGEAKVNANQKIFKNRKVDDKQRKIRINSTTEIYTSKKGTDEEIIADFKRRYGME